MWPCWKNVSLAVDFEVSKAHPKPRVFLSAFASGCNPLIYSSSSMFALHGAILPPNDDNASYYDDTKTSETVSKLTIKFFLW